jgi:hypothetical protein
MRNVLANRQKNLEPKMNSEQETMSNTDHKSRLDARNVETPDAVGQEHLESPSNATWIDFDAHYLQARLSSVDQN